MVLNLTEKGRYALDMALKHCRNNTFSAKDLSALAGSSIATITLSSLAKHGYLERHEGSPLTFSLPEDIDELLAFEAEFKKGCDKTNLEKAKKVKNNEFYTNLSDIEAECSKYKKFFRGKRILCNCNDGEQSHFWSYFSDNYDAFDLSGLIGIGYDANGHGYRLEMNPDLSVTRTVLQGTGGFETEESLEELSKCDIVVTNPPFSEFRNFIGLLNQYNKNFLVIGSENAFSYFEIFSLIKAGKIWVGYNKVKSFNQPDGTVKKFGNICWFTNLPTKKMEEPLALTATYYSDTNRRETYPKYDNYDAINVDKVVNIPKDYEGVMGVPITYLEKHCPIQFEIVGLMASTTQNEINHGYPYINNEKKYARVLIKRKSMTEDYLY